MPTLLRKISGAVVYVLFLALSAEIALQAYYFATAGDLLFRRTGVAIWAPNEYSGVFNRPNLVLEHGTHEFVATYYNNAEGFRVAHPGDEYSLSKRDGTYRVMLLGPSFAYGWGVDYDRAFAAILERTLESETYAGGRDVEIINAGVPSMMPAPHLRWYEHVGEAYHPDLVIQFIYGSMAVSNDPVMDAVATDEGYLVPKHSTLGQRVREKLKRFATIFYAWMLWTKIDASLTSSPTGENRAVLGAGRKMASAKKFDPTSAEVTEALEFYRDLDRVVRQSGADLLIVYFPLSYAIHPEDESRWRHLGVTDVQAQIDFDAAFTHHLDQTGMRVVNLTPALQRAAKEGDRLYYWLDIHWTERGNDVTARTVADYLVQSSVALHPQASPGPK